MIEILQPADWARPKGYSNGVAVGAGKTVYIAGQVGWNDAGQFDTDDFAGQVKWALKNIVKVLAEAGGKPSDLVRLTWFVTDKPAYLGAGRAIGDAYREVIGKHFPTMSVIFVSALVEDRAKVEIEATAVIQG